MGNLIFWWLEIVGCYCVCCVEEFGDFVFGWGDECVWCWEWEDCVGSVGLVYVGLDVGDCCLLVVDDLECG